VAGVALFVSSEVAGVDDALSSSDVPGVDDDALLSSDVLDTGAAALEVLAVAGAAVVAAGAGVVAAVRLALLRSCEIISVGQFLSSKPLERSELALSTK
jgi:hypothetical protein